MRIEEIIDGKIIGINETDNVITIFVRKGDVLYLLKIGKKYKLEKYVGFIIMKSVQRF